MTLKFFLDPKAKVGNNVYISQGAYICGIVTLDDDVFIGPNVVFVDSKFEKSKQSSIKVSKNVLIGGGSTIYPGVIIGENSVINPGSVVFDNIPSNVEVTGNPAKITAHLFFRPQNLTPLEAGDVEGVREYKLKNIVDLRGNLTVTEFDHSLPFVPKRLFFISGVPSEKIRGEHAHKKCEQLLVLASGSLTVSVEDGKMKQIIHLKDIGQAIYVPPMIWASQYNFRGDALLLVMASDHYDDTDYIRSYEDYLIKKIR